MDEDTKEYEIRIELSHDEQLDQFGWCMCENDGHKSKGCE